MSTETIQLLREGRLPVLCITRAYITLEEFLSLMNAVFHNLTDPRLPRNRKVLRIRLSGSCHRHCLLPEETYALLNVLAVGKDIFYRIELDNLSFASRGDADMFVYNLPTFTHLKQLQLNMTHISDHHVPALLHCLVKCPEMFEIVMSRKVFTEFSRPFCADYIRSRVNPMSFRTLETSTVMDFTAPDTFSFKDVEEQLQTL